MNHAWDDWPENVVGAIIVLMAAMFFLLDVLADYDAIVDSFLT